jgi:hypothetical protein
MRSPFGRLGGSGGGGGGGAPALFNFELLNDAGSAVITSVPNLRILISGDPTNDANWYALGSVPGHTLTIARGGDGKSLVISGWTGGIVPAGLQVHFEQRLPAEPNNAATTYNGLFAKRVGDAGPALTVLPGMSISATSFTAPVGVT